MGGLDALPRPVAVALGGGGVRGAAHVGVGHALEQRGFVPDLIVGTSVGALTGDLESALLASAAIPGVLPPVRRITPRRRAGAIAARAGLLMLHHQIERDLLEVSRQIPTVVLPTGVDSWPAPWDFDQSQRLITTASGTAGRFLDGLRISGPGLYRAADANETAEVAR